MLVLVWTNPLEPDFVLRTWPIIHDPLEAVASAMRTMSSEEKLLLGWVHFCLSCITCKYSDIYLFQKSSAIYCNCFHLPRMGRSLRSKSPGGRTGFSFSKSIGWWRLADSVLWGWGNSEQQTRHECLWWAQWPSGPHTNPYSFAKSKKHPSKAWTCVERGPVHRCLQL